MADVLRLKSHFQKHDQHPRNPGHRKAERLRHGSRRSALSIGGQWQKGSGGDKWPDLGHIILNGLGGIPQIHGSLSV